MRTTALLLLALLLAALVAEVAQAQTRQCISTRSGNTTYTTCY